MRPVEQIEEAALGLCEREAQVPLLGQRRVHHGERDLDQIERTFRLEVPGAEGLRDAGSEARLVGVAERAVVLEPEPLENGQIAVRIEAQVVEAMPGYVPGQVAHALGFARQLARIFGGRVAAVQADLGVAREQRLDQLPAQLVVALGRGAVRRMAVTAHDEEGRAGAAPAQLGRDLLEAPVGVAAAQLVQGNAGQRSCLAQRRPRASSQ